MAVAGGPFNMLASETVAEAGWPVLNTFNATVRACTEKDGLRVVWMQGTIRLQCSSVLLRKRPLVLLTG